MEKEERALRTWQEIDARPASRLPQVLRRRQPSQHAARQAQRAARTQAFRSLGRTDLARIGLGGPTDVHALQERTALLEQEIVDLQRKLVDQDEDLDAARAANRELLAELNKTARRC
ncbi:hypothetical protein ACWGJB_39535 [Streptomyces sp. NPDC054813]